MVNNSSRTTVKAANRLLVTLSAAKGLARWAYRCFAALSMTARAAVKAANSPLTGPVLSPNVWLEAGKSPDSLIL